MLKIESIKAAMPKMKRTAHQINMSFLLLVAASKAPAEIVLLFS